MDFMQSPNQQSFISAISSPGRNVRGWIIQEEPFEAQESDFVCEGDQNPLVPDRSSELAIEGWNLKKTIMDLNAQILKLNSELRTQKNLTKNLQKINLAVQNENKDRAKDNIHLRSTVASLEKQVHELTQQNASMNTNVSRNKRVAHQLQGKITDLSTSHTQQIKERDHTIQELKDQLAQLQEQFRVEKEQLETQVHSLQEERESLIAEVQSLARKGQDLENENRSLKADLTKAREQCTDAARFLNRELEKAFESMHTKLERVIAKKDEYLMKIMENDYEKDQILAYMLSEGLQLPHLVKLDGAKARERIRMENLSLDNS